MREEQQVNAYRNKITYLSFILAITVMLRHTVNIEIYNLNHGILYNVELFVRSVSEVAVPTFFALSGYLFFQNFRYELLLKKWKSRLFSIVFPYLIWNIIAYLYYQVLRLMPFARNNINGEIEALSLYNLIDNALWGHHNITWFLRNLIIYTIIAPLFWWLLRKKRASIILFIGTYVGAICTKNDYLIYAIYYLFGAYIGTHYAELVKDKCFDRKNEIFALIAILAFSMTGMFVEYPQWLVILIMLCSVVCVWTLADFVRTDTKPRWWMQLSFFIYCSHSIVLETVEKVFLLILGKNKIGALLDFVFAPGITLAIIIFAAYVLRKIPLIWGILNGKRG